MIDDYLSKLKDVDRRVRYLERLDVNPPVSSAVTFSGTPTAGRVAYWTGAGTIADSGIGTSGLVLTTGAQSIAGVKTFSNGINLGGTNLTVYEEGTWTPAIRFGSASTGITYSTQVGTYTRVGNIVTAKCRIILTSKGTSVGSLDMTGLPYAASSSANDVAMARWTNMATSYVAYFVLTQSSSTVLTFRALTAASGTGGTTPADTDFNNNSTLVFTIVYAVS